MIRLYLLPLFILLRAVHLEVASFPLAHAESRMNSRRLGISKSKANRLGQPPFSSQGTTEASFLHRTLVETCDDEYMEQCIGYLFFGDEDEHVHTSCGGLFREENGNWCFSEDLNEEVCCGDSSECCDVKVGAVVGTVVAFLALLSLCIVGCCLCCSCCPCHASKREARREEEVGATATVAPQVVHSGEQKGTILTTPVVVASSLQPVVAA